MDAGLFEEVRLFCSHSVAKFAIFMAVFLCWAGFTLTTGASSIYLQKCKVVHTLSTTLQVTRVTVFVPLTGNHTAAWLPDWQSLLLSRQFTWSGTIWWDIAGADADNMLDCPLSDWQQPAIYRVVLQQRQNPAGRRITIAGRKLQRKRQGETSPWLHRLVFYGRLFQKKNFRQREGGDKHWNKHDYGVGIFSTS